MIKKQSFTKQTNGYYFETIGIDLIPVVELEKLVAFFMKNLLAVALILTVVFGCDDENDVTPTKTKLLNVQVDASYATDQLDNWIVVHDEDGRLLAFKSFESNMTFELETDQMVSEKITITTIGHYFRNGTHYYSLFSYTKVAKGKTYVIKNNFGTAQTITGTLNVSVSDVVDIDQFSLSSRVGFSGSSSWSSATKILDIQTSTYSGISKYILSISDGNQMKYKVLDNVQANDSYNVSFTNMLPFDNSITLTFPACDNVTMYVNGS